MKKAAICLALSLFLPASLLPIDFGGVFQIDYYGLVDPLVDRLFDPSTFNESKLLESERIRITSAPYLKWKNDSGTADFFISGLAYIQPLGDPVLVDPERIIREAYLSLHLGIFDIYLGQKLVNWGKVDFLSPLNVINHSDTTVLSVDNLLEGPLPDLLAQVQIYPTDSLSFELVYAPFVQPNLYDIEDIRINPDTFTTPSGKTYYINAAFKDKKIGLFSEWAHSVYFAINYTSYIVDLIVSYSYYIDKNPDFDLSDITETVVEPDYWITGTAYPTYNRVHNVGLGLSFYLSDFLISADSALKITGDWEGSAIETRNSELFSALQVERMFRNRVRAHLNLYHRYIINYDTPIQSPYSPLIQTFIVVVIDDYLLQKPQSQYYLLAHLDSHFFREKLLLGVNFIYGYTEKGYYLVPRFTYKASDRITLSAGADIWIKGDVESFLGRNEPRDNFFVRVQYAL